MKPKILCKPLIVDQTEVRDGGPEAVPQVRPQRGTRKACKSERQRARIGIYLALLRSQPADTHQFIIRIVRYVWEPLDICSSWYRIGARSMLISLSFLQDAKKIQV